MSKKERILEKVRKLINLAEDAGASEGERENALRMAHKFLARHNLSMAELEAAGEEGEARVAEPFQHRNEKWRRQVMNVISQLFFCTYYHFNKTDRHMIVGRESNVVSARELADFVINSIHKESLAFGNSRISFANGATHVVIRKAQEIRFAAEQESQEEVNAKQAETSTAGTSMVLASVYEEEAKANLEKVTAEFGKPSKPKTRRSTVSDANAYVHGRAHGETINLNQQLENN